MQWLLAMGYCAVVLSKTLYSHSASSCPGVEIGVANYAGIENVTDWFTPWSNQSRLIQFYHLFVCLQLKRINTSVRVIHTFMFQKETQNLLPLKLQWNRKYKPPYFLKKEHGMTFQFSSPGCHFLWNLWIHAKHTALHNVSMCVTCRPPLS